MATSRYATSAALSNPTSTSSVGGTTASSQGLTEQQTSQQGTSQSSTQNMDPQSLAVLNALIKQLATGGTANMQEDRAAKQGEINTLTTNRVGYSKEAAFADAQGLMAQTMRQALEKLVPGINTGALGAGSSQSSMRALLTQRAAENAAEASSAQGLNAAVQYGGVANNMSSILANLIGQQDPATAALLQALNVAKGATVNTSGSSSQTGTSSTQTNQQQQGTSFDNKAISYGGPVATATPVTQGMGQLGGVETVQGKGTGSTADTLNQLYGNDRAWDSYTF